MRHRVSAIVFALYFSGCNASPVGHVVCNTTDDCPMSQVCRDGRCEAPSPIDSSGFDGGGPLRDAARPRVTSLTITPANPVISTVNGAPASVDLEVTANYDDGTTVPATGFWSVASSRLGDIDNTTGVFTADGTLAGTVEVSVEAHGRTATTTVTVRVSHEILTEGTPTDAPTHFTGTPVTDVSREANLLYPLEGTVFPENVFPPDVQWERGAEGDVYRVSLPITGASVSAYEIHTGAPYTYHWLIPRGAWRAVAESAPGTPATLTVDRWEAATDQVIAGTPRTFSFADAVIRGAIYYWDLGGGRIQRIRGDGTGLEAFMPNPPARAGDGRRCVACHTVSRDGTRMAAELWDGGDFSAIFDLTTDLSVDPAPTIMAPDRERFLGASFSPDNSRLIANNGNELFLLDGTSGNRVTALGSGLPATGAAHPTWSPDGTAIAFVMNTNGGWAVDFTQGDLGIIDVTAADTFAAPRSIFTGSPLVVARPSWSPNSQFIAIQHGLHSRAFQDPGGRRDATVRMFSRDGATTFDLERLNGGSTDSYYPTFSPFDEGGFFWLAFFSTRDYGNAQVGTRGTGRRQLWVAAVSSSPTAGSDPSHAAYWLPQQDVSAQNMAAFWAEEPCLADGRTCAASGECCGGFCRDTGDGPVCVPPDTVECSNLGEACGGSVECCEGQGDCVGNVCSTLG